MTDRKKIFELFETQREYVNEKTSYGIEHYRKGDAKITLIDKDGKPVKNAKVKIKQKSHEFRFGANLLLLDELETPEKNMAFRKYFSDVFNMGTVPFYWNTLEPVKGKPRYAKDSPSIYRRPPIDRCIEFCEENGIEPREHALAYEQFFPQWLYDASVEEIKKEFERRCEEISSRYADKINTIEVTNEMCWPKGKTKFYDEPDYVEWCFKTARKYFPHNQLAINEGHLSWEANGRATDSYYAYLEANLLKGAPIDAIGMQYHNFVSSEHETDIMRFKYNPEHLYRQMDLYSHFDKPLQISEVTIPAYSWEEENEAIQAELLEKLYTIWFSHKNVEQIVYWNLVDGYCYLWTNDLAESRRSLGNMTIGENYFHGGLIRFDLTPKPAYLKLKELIQKKWHTEEEAFTDENGVVCFRGFYGNYEVAAEFDGATVVKEISLSKKGDNNYEWKL